MSIAMHWLYVVRCSLFTCSCSYQPSWCLFLTRIKTLTAAQPGTLGLRIGVRTRGCNGEENISGFFNWMVSGRSYETCCFSGQVWVTLSTMPRQKRPRMKWWIKTEWPSSLTRKPSSPSLAQRWTFKRASMALSLITDWASFIQLIQLVLSPGWLQNLSSTTQI